MEKILYALNKFAGLLNGVETEREMLIRLIASVAVIAVGIIFRKQISKGIIFVVTKLFFRKSEKAQNAIKACLIKPLSCFIGILGFYIGVEILLPVGKVHSTALLVLKIAIICITAWFAFAFINSDYSFIKHNDESNAKKTAEKFISNVTKAAIGVIAGLLILEQFGISASRIFAALGIGGVAVAFACKDAVENMLSGFIIIFDKPFEVDDFIEINGDSGTVKDIKIRSTRLVGVDGCEKVYPNTMIANSSIINWTKMDKRALSETLWISYSHSGDEVVKFCDEIKKILGENESILPDDIRVNFTKYGTHALEISLFCYTDKTAITDFLKVKNDVNVAIKEYADSSDMVLSFESKTLFFGNELSVKK